MKIFPLLIGTAVGFGLVTLLGGKSKARAAVPNAPVQLEEIVIYGDPVAPPSPQNPPVIFHVGDHVRVLTLGRIGQIIDFPRAIDPRYPPVGVQIPGFPYQVFAAQDIQQAG